MQGTDSSSRDLVKDFENICRREGLKLTYQRLAILHALANAKDHPGAEDMYEQVKSKVPPISFDTVYRTLALFERCGVIARVQCPDDRARYDPNTAPHPHIVCMNCKKIEDFHSSTFDEVKIPEETEQWGLIKSKHLEFRGICRKCLENEKEGGARG
ncbi:MAG: transcriptional repressor [Proteobacteria bacterium]|nr:transcriptional repressor [Pseudomonadota bacterium]